MARNSRRRYYLQDVPLDEALERYRQALERVGALGRSAGERVHVREALGGVTAAPVWAARSSPHYDAAAMDGIAVRAADTVGASETSPLALGVPERARWVDTGDPIPDGFDAVIMIEVVAEIGGGSAVEIRAPVAPYSHVRPLGEDIAASELLIPENHRLRPADLAACAAAGVLAVEIRKPPSVGIIPTGSELVEPEREPKPGEIVEFNSLMLAGMLTEWGAAPVRLPPVADDPALLEAALADALARFDIVLINAGSSAGAEDYTAPLIEKMGELVAHGVAIRPGHPIALGVVGGKPVVGIPGYPVSAAVACELFVQPIVEAALGRRSAVPYPAVRAAMTRRVQSPMGEDEFLRVRLGQVGERLVAAPLQRGAGVITSLVRADGVALIPRMSEGVEAGAEISVRPLRPPDEIRRNIMAIGSHDMILDLAASRLSADGRGAALSSANVGSLGGLLAIRRGEAHLAGTHLLDERTGAYNVSYIRRYARGVETALVRLAGRTQGLMAARGNPLGVKALADLTREGVRFVNRQRGSGTRVLLDYKLREAGIDADDIAGYEREEYTHLGVAAAVSGGKADAALGILPAARALGLDFIPLFDEEYDLAIPTEFYESELMRPLLDLIRSDEFQREVESLGGYDARGMGRLKTVVGAKGG